MPQEPNHFTLQRTFSSLKHRNFRLFWTGQCVSLIGTWMQNIAQAWLVLELTKSAFWLGVVSAIQFLPMLLFSLYAGTLLDRFSKRKIILSTQIAMMILALILAIDTQWHTVKLWHVLFIAGLLGVANTLDMPGRQAFMIELVGKEDLMNAIILNSSIFNAARVIGPSVAGFAIAKLGMDSCFYLNALSFVPVIIGIYLIRMDARPKSIRPMPKEAGTLQEIALGLRYVWKTPGILLPMILMAIVNIFAFNFNVLIPLYAKNVFHGGAQDLGYLMSANGLGALLGAVIIASRNQNRPSTKILIFSGLGVCLMELLLVPVANQPLACGLLAVAGFSMIAFSTTNNSLIQIQAPDELRGRIMSVYALVFAGFSPIGSFLSGSAAHLWGAPAAFGLGAGLAMILIAVMVVKFPNLTKSREPI